MKAGPMARLVDAMVFAIGFLSALVAASSSFVTFVDTKHMLLCSLGSLIVGIGIASNPDVDVGRRSRITVITDCIATDQQIFSAAFVQQPQELFEVGR